MAQEYITLDQAAQRLGVRKEQFLELADKSKLRRFNGPDTVRFWKHQVEELGRQMGMGSDPDVQPGDATASPENSDLFAFDVAGEEGGSSTSNILIGGGQKKPGSDSDVRLVPQGSDIELKADVTKPAGGAAGRRDAKGKLDSDSDVKLVEDDSAVPIGREPTGTEKTGGSSGKLLDSGVRLVEDHPARRPPSDTGLLTEELDLDSELRQAEKTAKPPSSKSKGSVFELSSDSGKAKGKKAGPSSSEFDMSPGARGQPSDSVFDSSSEQISLNAEDDSSIHVSANRDLGIGDASGINLHKPSDKGISLEKDPAASSSESLTFDLAMDAAPKKKADKKKPVVAADADSSSEFELTLDDAGLAPLESGVGSKDVFKTNLGAAASPKAADSSGDMAEGSDEFAETSDFELALDEDSSSVESETGSEVIVIDEDAGEADATALRPGAMDGDDIGEVLEGDEELSVEDAADDLAPAGRRQLVAVEAPPAEWGIWGAVHFLTLIMLIPTGFLLFEMLRSIWGYNKDTLVTGKMFEMISGMMK